MPDMESLKPKDHAEELAIFRSEIIGALTRRELDHGALRALLVELAAARYRPPRAHGTRQYSVSTLERWYYAYSAGGLDALRPEPRSDAGRARELTAEQRQLLCDIRREHPIGLGAAHPAHAVDRRPPRQGRRLAPRRCAGSSPTAGSIASRCATAPAPRRGCAGRPSAPARSGRATSATGRRLARRREQAGAHPRAAR